MTEESSFAGASSPGHSAPAGNGTGMEQQERPDAWDVLVVCVFEGWLGMSSIPERTRGSEVLLDMRRSYERPGADVDHVVVDIVENIPYCEISAEQHACHTS